MSSCATFSVDADVNSGMADPFWCCRNFGVETACVFESNPDEVSSWVAENAGSLQPLGCQKVVSAPLLPGGPTGDTIVIPDTADAASAPAAVADSPAGTSLDATDAGTADASGVGNDAGAGAEAGAADSQTAGAAVLTTTPAAPSGGLSSGVAAAIGIVVVLVVLAFLAGVFVARRRVRKNAAEEFMRGGSGSGRGGGLNEFALPFSPASASLSGSIALGDFTTSEPRAAGRATDMILRKQLKALAKERFCLAGRFTLHGPKEITADEGGVVVAVAPMGPLSRPGRSRAAKLLSVDATGKMYAIDEPADTAEVEECSALFHSNYATFERERAVLTSQEWKPYATALVAALPSAGNDPIFARGSPLPPCVVTEAGETLREWAAGRGGDARTLARTLLDIAQLLGKLHGDGLVHRDLRPESLRWLPHRLEWAMVNFGFSARAGALRHASRRCSRCPRSCSLTECVQ